MSKTIEKISEKAQPSSDKTTTKAVAVRTGVRAGYAEVQAEPAAYGGYQPPPAY